MKNQICPICLQEVTVSDRYPNYVCRNCVATAKTSDGRSLQFFNVGLWGGFQAVYSDTKERYESHICYINNVECRADEAHFGGIVVQPTK